MTSFQGVVSSTVYRSDLISGGWNRGVPLYTEVTSFQGVGIERFHRSERFGKDHHGIKILKRMYAP